MLLHHPLLEASICRPSASSLVEMSASGLETGLDRVELVELGGEASFGRIPKELSI
jgi:hypothetical protein